MDLSKPAQTNYNGGIIFLSYVIAVIGAMTTLELLQRRTHIRGSYNWFLLFAAAVSMGGVGIWSMHFIGNNSLTITIENGDQHQLSYATGFTFASLIVAILTMFFAFAFVGITEEAEVGRIIPSGIIAGFGIVSMHYLGQIAVNFFIMKNKLALVVTAAVIAVCAVTAALFIFFKLREQWANQWYKRLGCAMLMGVAVCGMHYTALVGTMYYPGDLKSGPPVPLLGTPALIGIIAAIVIVACIILFSIGAKNQYENNSILFQKTKKSHKRLILDTIFFDTNGRILVKVDGIVPMKQILNEIPEDEANDSFSASHPLFTRLFETTMQWAKSSNSSDKEVFDSSSHLSHASSNFYSVVDDAFLTAANELVEELRFTRLSDLGYLFDSILNTNMISKKSMFSQESSKNKNKPYIRRSTSTAGSFLLSPSRFSAKESTATLDEIVDLSPKKSNEKNKSSSLKRSPSTASQPGDATVIDIFNNATTSASISRNLTVRDCDSEDRHIFLVKKIESNKDLVNLLSIGFRFAEPVFISKTMGEKLQVPSEYMLNYFKDMLQMTETASAMYTPNKPSNSFYTSPAQQRQMKNDNVRGGVFVGLFTLIEDNDDNMLYIIVQKQKRYAFPMVQLILEGETESERKPTELSKNDKNTVLSLSGQSLANIASIDFNTHRNHQRSKSISKQAELSPGGLSVSSAKTLIDVKSSFSPSDDDNDENILYNYEPISSTSLIRNKDLETQRFTKALEIAAKSLISMSSYGKLLASTARLYSEILDIPAFSVHSGPCQLILFRAHITTPGTRFAINQTLTETIKCIPFPMYRSFAFFITDIAVEKYRAEQNKHKAPSNYFTQQRLYQNTAAQNNDKELSTDDNLNMDDLQEDGSTALTTYRPAAPKVEVSPVAIIAPQQSFSSLPPPPRVKRNKFTFPTGIASLEISPFNKDFLPNMIKGANVVPLSSNPSSSVEMPIILNLLPASARFWWLNNMYEETHNT